MLASLRERMVSSLGRYPLLERTRHNKSCHPLVFSPRAWQSHNKWAVKAFEKLYVDNVSPSASLYHPTIFRTPPSFPSSIQLSSE